MLRACLVRATLAALAKCVCWQLTIRIPIVFLQICYLGLRVRQRA